LAVHGRSRTDRVLKPLNRLSSQRFLRESRITVWHNAVEFQAARLSGPTAYETRLAEREVLSAARIADPLTPGQELLRAALAGFGVTLPPPACVRPPGEMADSALLGQTCRSGQRQQHTTHEQRPGEHAAIAAV
jgi:hypothetical protein